MNNVAPLHALVKRPHNRGRNGSAAPRVTQVHRVSKATVQGWRSEDYPDDVERPVLRGDCLGEGVNAERPCPFVSCRAHLALDITKHDGVLENFPGVELEDMPDTCALDVADRGGVTLEDVAQRLNVSRERIRQIEAAAIRKKKASLLAIARDNDIDVETPQRVSQPDRAEVATLPAHSGPTREEQLAAARAAGAARGSLGTLHKQPRKQIKTKREAVLEAEQFGQSSRVVYDPPELPPSDPFWTDPKNFPPDSGRVILRCELLPLDVPRVETLEQYDALFGEGDTVLRPAVEAYLQTPIAPIALIRIGEPTALRPRTAPCACGGTIEATGRRGPMPQRCATCLEPRKPRKAEAHKEPGQRECARPGCTELVVALGHSLYHSDNCQHEAERERRNAKRAAGEVLPLHEPRTCKSCPQLFTPHNPNQRYCPKCRAKPFYQRRETVPAPAETTAPHAFSPSRDEERLPFRAHVRGAVIECATVEDLALVLERFAERTAP